MEDNIENFLKSCGLSDTIPVFNRHKIRLDHLDELCNDDIKELLPALGDRLELKKEIKRRGETVNNRLIKKPKKKSDADVAPTKKFVKNDPERKAFIVQKLQDDRHVAELYQMATKVLIEFSLFSFESGFRAMSSDWTLIDFADGNLNCLLCKRKIRIQIREDSRSLWNVGNYKRHFQEEHRNDLNTILDLGTEETRGINPFLKLSMETNERNRWLQPSLNSNSKFEETVFEELVVSESNMRMSHCIGLSDSSNEAGLSEPNDLSTVPGTEKTRETYSFLLVSMDGENTTLSAPDVNASNLLDIDTLNESSSSSNGKDVDTNDLVVFGKSVITEDIDTNTGGYEQLTTSDGVFNSVGELNATAGNSNENTKHKLIKSAVTELNKIQNEAWNRSSQSMVTEVTRTPISSQADDDIFDDANLPTETRSTSNDIRSIITGVASTNGNENLKAKTDAVSFKDLEIDISPSIDANEIQNLLNGKDVDTNALVVSGPSVMNKIQKEAWNRSSDSMVTEVTRTPISSQSDDAIFDDANLPTEKRSTSDDIRSLITEVASTNGNVNEKAKTDEVSVKDLEIDISPSIDAKEIQNLLNSKDVDTIALVVSGASMITEDIDGNNHSKFISLENVSESNMEISGGLKVLTTSDGVLNSAVSEAWKHSSESHTGVTRTPISNQNDGAKLPTETRIDLNAYQQTNQQKLALEALVEDFLEQDIAKKFDTETEILDSNAIIPDEKTENEEEKKGPVPDWLKPGVKFGWAIKSSNNRFYPGFLLQNKEFRWITTKSQLSSYTFKPVEFHEKLKKSQKNKAQLEHLRKFNNQKETSFA